MEQDVVVAHLTTPQEIALKRMLKYKLYALPVIEDNQKIHQFLITNYYSKGASLAYSLVTILRVDFSFF